MGLIVQAFKALKVPIGTTFLDKGRISDVWERFFILVQDSLRPLGVEKSFNIVNNMNTKTFNGAGIVDQSFDTITISDHGFYTGLKVTASGVNLATPLVDGTSYYVIRIDADVFKLATTYTNAITGTVIDIQTTGGVSQVLTPHADISGMRFSKTGESFAMVEYLAQRSYTNDDVDFATTDVNIGSDTITISSHGYYDNLKVTFTSTTQLPTPLVEDTFYYVSVTGANTFKLTAEKSGGSVIDITFVGAGTHTIQPEENNIEGGIINFVYNSVLSIWEQNVIDESKPNDAEIVFSINASGQVTYETVGFIGTKVIDKLYWRSRTLTGKNVAYSTTGGR